MFVFCIIMATYLAVFHDLHECEHVDVEQKRPLTGALRDSACQFFQLKHVINYRPKVVLVLQVEPNVIRSVLCSKVPPSFQVCPTIYWCQLCQIQYWKWGACWSLGLERGQWQSPERMMDCGVCVVGVCDLLVTNTDPYSFFRSCDTTRFFPPSLCVTALQKFH